MDGVDRAGHLNVVEGTKISNRKSSTTKDGMKFSKGKSSTKEGTTIFKEKSST